MNRSAKSSTPRPNGGKPQRLKYTTEKEKCKVDPKYSERERSRSDKTERRWERRPRCIWGLTDKDAETQPGRRDTERHLLTTRVRGKKKKTKRSIPSDRRSGFSLRACFSNPPRLPPRPENNITRPTVSWQPPGEFWTARCSSVNVCVCVMRGRFDSASVATLM